MTESWKGENNYKLKKIITEWIRDMPFFVQLDAASNASNEKNKKELIENKLKQITNTVSSATTPYDIYDIELMMHLIRSIFDCYETISLKIYHEAADKRNPIIFFSNQQLSSKHQMTHIEPLKKILLCLLENMPAETRKALIANDEIKKLLETPQVSIDVQHGVITTVIFIVNFIDYMHPGSTATMSDAREAINKFFPELKRATLQA